MTTLTLRPAVAPPIRWSQTAFHKLPEGPPFYELEQGELLQMARPRGRHQRILTKLLLLLNPFIESNELGQIWPEVEVDITPTQTYIPDLTFLSTQNLPQFENDLQIVGPPNLVVEITSPSTAGRDHSVKLWTYQQAGVAWYWLVEEDLGIVEYKNSPAGYLVNQVAEPGQPFSPAIFPGLTFNLAELMGETV